MTREQSANGTGESVPTGPSPDARSDHSRFPFLDSRSERHDIALDAQRHALQARAFMTASDQTLERLRAAVAGRYRVDAELGRGAMGIVYLAYDPRLKRPIAIKLLAPELAADRKERKQFLREAQTAARFSHPNIVPVYSVEQAGDFVFFTMEYVLGATLADWVLARGGLPVGEATWIMHDVARAVGYAHRRGVIHRDLKPENVMIDAMSDRVMVMDFGFARVEAEPDIERVGYVLGTAPFISPERLAGAASDKRSDVYALGVTAYFTVTGALPFDGETSAEIFRQHVSVAAPTLHLTGKDSDRTYSDAVGRCLEKDPKRRFRDGEDLANALAKAPEIRGRELPVPLEAFVSRLRQISAATGGLSILVTAAAIALPDGVFRGNWVEALGAAGFLGLVAAGFGKALRPILRRVIEAGHTQRDLVHALNVDRQRDREVIEFEHGPVSPAPAQIARRMVYAGVATAIAGALLIPLPLLDPTVGLMVMGGGVVLTFYSTIVGLLFGRRLNRPAKFWTWFWRSRWGGWMVRRAERRIEDMEDDLVVDSAGARRIREWVEDE